MAHIQPVFEYDIRPLAQAVAALGEAEWEKDEWRQTVRGTPHAGSQTIFLRRQPGETPRDILTSMDVFDTEYCRPPFSDALTAISRYAKAPLARAMIVRLPAMATIKPHVDEGQYAEATNRFHLPIETNLEAWLEVDGERLHLQAGTVFSFNKHLPHRGANLGWTPRLHVIADVWR